ncbi:L,D-transpeptidase Cds6 family protein [Desulfohalovibrio reitneri]|uniref:L,D-transpeptidase Cds6 family protein n=1 Tax=Desulfohalovibrio reitneri TaxID=1307759 RepID=UPI0004A6E87A|nr:L,D-transpeptidase family protein [Desulfohalovibrio reitneri]
MRPFPAIAAALLAAAVLAGAPGARAWDLTLQDSPTSPEFFLAVAKQRQTVLAFGRHSPLNLRKSLTCTTGQKPGDKLREGDLKTPEGVYFVQRKRTGGLDFELYGDTAYTLDYPNPVDVLKGKTGSGIWVHGRGRALTPRDTKGCVALNNDDLAGIGPDLAPGVPVVIAREVAFSAEPGEMSRTAEELARRVRGWAEAWAAKSPEFFSYYHPGRYSKAERAFERFRQRKQRIFDQVDWIAVRVHDIRALPGPDYWVTWFGQYYRTPQMDSQIVKRLYWQKDEDGEWRIVGNEYARPEGDYRRDYLLHARQEAMELVAGWREAWERADLEEYASYYAPGAEQEGREGLEEITAHKREVWDKGLPERVDVEGFSARLHPDGLQVSFTQRYSAESGYSDVGRKTLVLEPSGDGWRIVSEEWRRIS